MHRLLCVIWLLLATLCFFYGNSVLATASGTGFYMIWFVLGLCFIFLAVGNVFGLWKLLPRMFKIFLVVGLVTGICFFVEFLGFVFSTFHAKGPENLDYIVVLGAQVRESGPSVVLRYRLDTAIKYLEDNPDTLCIVSGGQGDNEPFSEAYGMADYLMAHGIESNRILLENRAANTEENLRFSRMMMEEGTSFGIVTNNFHLFRAIQMAKSFGYENVYGIAADSTPFYLPNNILREFLGEIKFLLKQILK